jgi:flagellar protein FlaJ
MAHQITWGITVDKVIDQEIERVKKSRRLVIAWQTIKETLMSGGDMVSILESVADTAMVLEESEKEKKSLLNQYVVLMYAIVFIFVGIVAAINKLMVPIFKASTIAGAEQVLGMTNPCDACGGFGCDVCGLYGLVSKIFSIDPGTIGSYYTAIFFFMSIIEAAFAGLVAGQISENSIFAGIKHSIILLTTTFAAFSILIRLKILGV